MCAAFLKSLASFFKTHTVGIVSGLTVNRKGPPPPGLSLQLWRRGYLRRSGPVTAPGAVVVDMAVEVVVDVVVVVEPVFRVGMTAADSFSFSFSLSALSSDQYLMARMHGCKASRAAAPVHGQHPPSSPTCW